jgi:hypothetical protein
VGKKPSKSTVWGGDLVRDKVLEGVSEVLDHVHRLRVLPPAEREFFIENLLVRIH